MRSLEFRWYDDTRERMMSGESLFWNGNNFVVGIWNYEETHIVDGEKDAPNLMQFTGKLDKNGVKIYDGDILAGVNGSINGTDWKWGNYEIKYEDGNHNVPLDWGGYENHNSTHWFEVIGNIYENPELRGDEE